MNIHWQPRGTQPPKDGSEFKILIRRAVKAYWDDDLKTYVLSRPLHIESIRESNVEAWAP